MKYGRNIYILVPVKLGYMYLSSQASGNDDYTCQFATRIMNVVDHAVQRLALLYNCFLFTVLFSLPT